MPSWKATVASVFANAFVIVQTTTVVFVLLVITASPLLNFISLPTSVVWKPSPPLIPVTAEAVILTLVPVPDDAGVRVVVVVFASKYGPVAPKSTSVSVQDVCPVLDNFAGSCASWTIYITSADCANCKSNNCADVYVVDISNTFAAVPPELYVV